MPSLWEFEPYDQKGNSKNCHSDLQQMFFKTFKVVYQQTLHNSTSSTVHEF
jgi:hypothetical protein